MILYNHRRMNHPRDSNNNPEKGVHDVSDGLVKKKALMDQEVDVPDPTDYDHGNVPDTNSTEDSKDDSCMEVHGDVELVREYENISGDIVWSGKNVDNMKDGRLVVSHD